MVCSHTPCAVHKSNDSQLGFASGGKNKKYSPNGLFKDDLPW